MRFVLAMTILVSCGSRLLAEDDIPDDAARLIAAFEEDAEAIRFEAERKIALRRQELAKQLKTIQDTYTRAAKLDEAVAIRDFVRDLATHAFQAEPAPPNVLGLTGKAGRSFYFTITGNNGGTVYGTDVYTGDSSLATAVVHAGLLKHGESGVVKVRVLPGRNSYASTSRNGVTSRSWGSYSISFSVESPPAFEIPRANDEAAAPGFEPAEPASDAEPASEEETSEDPEE